jgi:biotin carboxyl carrier protein
MELEFRFGDTTHKILVEPENSSGGFRAVVDGKAMSAQISRISDSDFVLIDGSRIRHIYAASHENKVYVHIDGKVISLEHVDSDQKSFSSESLDFGSKDRVTTPMPGKIVKILVREGDRVSLKQPLVIVESMKMENELRSPADGVVKSINFGPGDLVGTDQPIIKIEPE